MAQKPIDGGAYYQDADGNLVKLDEDQLVLDPQTRELKRSNPPKPKAEQPAAPTTKK
jgi:hypothetical protein